MNLEQACIQHFEAYPNSFVDINVFDPDAQVTRIMTYKVLQTPGRDDEDRSVRVYNYITDQEQSIPLENIESISWHNLDETDEFHLEIINKHKQYDGWDRDGWGLFDEDQQLTERYKERYFLSHNGAKISAEQAYMLAKMDVKNLDEFYDLPVSVLKEKWLDMIISFKTKAIDMLNKEMVECEEQNLVDDIEEIKVIIEMLSGIDQEAEQELEKLESVDQVMSYWPPLLLPAPVFSYLAYE